LLQHKAVSKLGLDAGCVLESGRLEKFCNTLNVHPSRTLAHPPLTLMFWRDA
jgi:hypothetical protein